MRISIDLDGVLIDFNEKYLKVIEDLFPGRIPIDFVVPAWYPRDWGLSFTKADETKIWNTIEKTHNYWLEQKPILSNVNQVVRLLTRRPDIEVFYITHRTPTAGLSVMSQCNRWLSQYHLISDNTATITTGNHKPMLYEELDIDASIDDRPENVPIPMSSIPGSKNHYLLTASYNQKDMIRNRVESVEEFLDKTVYSTYKLTVHSDKKD